MKSVRIAIRILLGAVILFGIFLLFIDNLPEFSSSKPIFPGNPGMEIRAYVTENVFAIVCFVASFTLGLIIGIYGFSLRRQIGNERIDSGAAIILGLFILLSGVWILTDSKI